MEELSLYLFKSSICSAIFLGIYGCFFKSQTFFRFNRHFLLAGLILSVFLPLYTYTYQVSISMGDSGPSGVAQIPIETDKNSLIYLAIFAYALGILILLMRYLAGIIRLATIVNRTGYTSMNDYRLVTTDAFNSTFSVFNYIFIDTSANLSNTEKELILAHELAHVRQHHWIDLMLAQLFCTLQWFNPFMWLYLKSIRQNQEYLADEAVLQQGTSAAVYRAILLNQSIGTRVFSFSNSFCQYPMSRIKMLSRPSSGWSRKVAVIIIIPAFAIFYWTFSKANIIVKVSSSKNIVRMQVVPVKPVASAEKKTRVPHFKRKFKPTNDLLKPINAAAISLADSPKNAQNAPTHVITEQSAHEPSPLFLLDGVEVSSDIRNIDPNTIAEIHVLKDELGVAPYGDRGKGGVVLIYTKKSKLKSSQ